MTAAEVGRTSDGVLASESFKTEMASLRGIRAFVDKWATQLGLDNEKTFRIKVAVSEACANAIEHSPDKHDITLWVWNREGRFTVDVWHAGQFRPRMRQDQDHRGMGLPLMVACADEVSFAAMPEGGTRVSLSVFFR